ncbi:hypothetical protein QMO56_04335 [Roseomonas sp. E05]|uniref:hypothetical protein n=1 Tax=Roseomonas sp. E05 TaxID=3046310 RepID=UPI0024BAB429|nr:hypothetical protein [Roseomonas sp. E05]MDJ0387335.1 hypothetical protein [Roseomonas sp. E05]
MAFDLTNNALFSGAIGSIAGGVIGAFIPLALSAAREKVYFSLRLVEQFDSHAMYQTRSKAWHFLSDGRLENSFTDDPIYLSKDADDLWALLGSYKVIGISVGEKKIREEIIIKGFSQTFIWWYYAAFKNGLIPLGPKWDLVNPIQSFHDWLQARIESAKFDEWKKAGEESRSNAIGRLKPSHSVGDDPSNSSNNKASA